MRQQDFNRELTIANMQTNADLHGIGIAGTYQARMAESINYPLLRYIKDEGSTIACIYKSLKKTRKGKTSASQEAAAPYPPFEQNETACQPA